jgi:hypothetical protein
MRRMRRMILKLAVFFALIEGLAHVDLLVLIAGMAVGLALVICSDLLLASPSPR